MDDEKTKVKALMALTDEERISVGKESARNADESSLCSTPLLLKKLDGAEPGFGTKTVKSILKSKFTFKAETLKGITLNEPSLASARGNKISSASKTNSAPVDMTCELRLLLSCLGLFLFVMALFIHAS
nr:hypothetical protein [Tanacetum cinerariifolium]